MRFSVEIRGVNYQIDDETVFDLSIPVEFTGPRLKAFSAKTASAKPYTVGDFQLSVEKGAGCNCPVFNFAAHLHGTHTECVGHISKTPLIWQDTLKIPSFMTAELVTLQPVLASDYDEWSYEPKDWILTAATLKHATEHWTSQPEALLVRTHPNEPTKRIRDYDLEPPAYFSREAMEYIVELGVEHILIDLPSVDRADDGGKLANHHLYWGTAGEEPVSSKSITELIYVPNEAADGSYVLQLQLANIRSDAAPSRPLLFPRGH